MDNTYNVVNPKSIIWDAPNKIGKKRERYKLKRVSSDGKIIDAIKLNCLYLVIINAAPDPLNTPKTTKTAKSKELK